MELKLTGVSETFKAPCVLRGLTDSGNVGRGCRLEEHVEKKAEMAPKVLSFFSGGGGLDLGFAACGFNMLFETDIDPFSCKTLAENCDVAVEHGLDGFRNASVLQADAFSLHGDKILKKLALEPSDVDVLIGGPPCQAFSVFGKRKGTADRRGQLSFEYIRLLSELKPKVFVFENVYGILTVQNGEVFSNLLEELAQDFSGTTYSLFWQRVNAKDFGVPQHRDRVIVVGVRNDVDCDTDALKIIPLEGMEPQERTVRDAFRNLPSPGRSKIANHTGRRHSQRIIDRYRALRPGERDPKTRINKLNLALPSFTIIVGSDHGGGKGHVHPVEPREVTPRESARVQTFPDWWTFAGTGRHCIRQVGNAVPPLLGAAIADMVRSQIFRQERTPMKTVLHRLSQEHLFQ